MSVSERIRFLVVLSAEPHQIPGASERIATQLSEQFGGATVIGGADEAAMTGYWADDGQAFKNRYEGRLHKESVFGVLLMVMPEDEERAYVGIQEAVTRAVSEFQLNSRHIHVEVSQVRARHFEVHQAGH